MSAAEPSVLVVHCVDTEGPLGGDARRQPDGSPEFFDNWDDILSSLADLTSERFRGEAADSFGRAYRFNWFVLDFTGFRTNPKNRVAEYHDTLDNIRSLPVGLDGVYLHHHVPPVSGVGDEWSESWLSSNEINIVVARRLLERGEFPAAFRAGGTIEDNAASHWLEHAIPIDFSNRVSERSEPGADLFHFNWHGAPAVWGSYHPALHDVMQAGSMRRFVYRSLDLRSRYNEITPDHVMGCFEEVSRTGSSAVLSYFSHDNRDMRSETADVIPMLRRASEATGIPWRSCTAVEAHREFHSLDEKPIDLQIEWSEGALEIGADAEPFQRTPFVGAHLVDGRFVRLHASQAGVNRWRVSVAPDDALAVGAAVTSIAGVSTVAVA
jgi:hypothetical protein